MVKKESGRYGIASFVLAITSILFFLLEPVPLILSILAIIFAVVQRRKKITGLATAGLIIGIIMTIMN